VHHKIRWKGVTWATENFGGNHYHITLKLGLGLQFTLGDGGTRPILFFVTISWDPVMWSETVGLIIDKTGLRLKKSVLVLVLQV